MKVSVVCPQKQPRASWYAESAFPSHSVSAHLWLALASACTPDATSKNARSRVGLSAHEIGWQQIEQGSD
eukprot:scaffold78403_cov30-Tisochrysis_lutea.AAC.1